MLHAVYEVQGLRAAAMGSDEALESGLMVGGGVLLATFAAVALGARAVRRKTT